MRRKIQKSLTLIVWITLVLSFFMMIALVYNEALVNMKQEVKQEAAYIREAVELLGDDYLEEVTKFTGKNRLTIIQDDGKVLYDSEEDENTMSNHGERKEVKDAFEQGSGEETRLSDTLGKQTFYYAFRLNNGTVLRVSQTTDSVVVTIQRVLPVIVFITVIMIGLAWILGKWQTARLIKPINELDLEEPLKNDVYEELTPLLESMDKQNKEKEKIAQMRKEFSANVSHELKTPLTSISGYAEIMMNGLVKPEDVPQFSERIYHEASRLITLVEDIIKISKLDEGTVEIEKENVDLYWLAREICSRLSPQAEKKKVQVEVTGEPVEYRGIRQILDEMIYNICENAIKYNHEGGTVKVWVGNTLKGKKIVVNDTGIGIPQEEQDRIFERFYRVDKSHSKESGGTGLGLSIVKHGALLHHADIKVVSRLGEGTKIEVTF